MCCVSTSGAEEFLLVNTVRFMCVGSGMRKRPRKQSSSVNIYTLGNVILNHCVKLDVFHSLCTSQVLHIETCGKEI